MQYVIDNMIVRTGTKIKVYMLPQNIVTVRGRGRGGTVTETGGMRGEKIGINTETEVCHFR